MPNNQSDNIRAQSLNQAIMAMAEQTAVHQRDAKVVDLVLKHQLESQTLATATASLQFNSQVSYESTEQLRRAMKIMLDAQMLAEDIAVAQHAADLIIQQIASQNNLVAISEKQISVMQRTAELIAGQINAQNTLAAASDKQARASNFLGVVNIILAAAAVLLAATQVYIAIRPLHPS